jgi:hypothetical protein
MPALALTPAQEKTKGEIEALLDELLRWNRSSYDEIQARMDRLADLCFSLHQELKIEGQEPAYTAQVLAKRGMRADSREFYRHMYAAEALLRFLQEGPPAKPYPPRADS